MALPTFFLIALLVHSSNNTSWDTISLILTFVLEGLMLVLAFLFTIGRYHCSWKLLGFRNFAARSSLRFIVGALLLIFGTSYAWSAFIRAIGRESILPQTPTFLQNGGPALVLGILLAVAIAPVIEETFFRGFILQGLMRRFGVFGAAATSAFLFSMAHLEPGALLPIFVIGLLLAWVHIRTKSIWNCILLHMAYNAIVLYFSL